MVTIVRNQPRAIKITPNINPYAHGSAIVEFGNTKVHVTASVEETVPPFLKNQGKGWVTGEYSMLPGSTHTRSRRDREKISGRTQEIQRLIGRSLRAVIDTKLLGERTITLDCDVLVADGGTRTASISGAYVALSLAVKRLMKEGKLAKNPIIGKVGALSVGLTKEGGVVADLNYEEDSQCGTDMNIVMNDKGQFIELQGTAETVPFDQEQLNAMLETGKSALAQVFRAQDEALR